MADQEDPKQVEPPRPKLPRGIGDHIKAVGAYSILLGFLAIGATIATIFWSSSNANLQTDLRRAQEALTEARSELSQIKSEYAQYRGQTKTKQANNQDSSIPPTTKPSPTIQSPSSITVEETQQEITVEEGKTVSLFSGDILISLVQTSFEGSPLSQKVFATVGSPNYPNLKIERQDVGYSVTYKGKAKYEIRIIAADTFSAKFLVTKGD
jgi:ribosomal protein L29